jgi:arylsulfatase A-like enzyme
VADIKQGILLITIDCGRKDAVYGSAVKTPNIDRLRDESITFNNAFSQSSTTLPSLYSLFLSQYVSSHGVLSNSHYKELGEYSLPNLLAQEGWQSKAFTGSRHLEFSFGEDFNGGNFSQRREQITKFKKRLKTRVPPLLAAKIERSIFRKNRINAQRLVREALSYLKSAEGKVFVWLHFFDAHMEYHSSVKWVRHYYTRPLEPSNASVNHQLKNNGDWFPAFSFGALLKMIKDLNYYPSLYKAALSHIDEQLGYLFNAMRSMGIYDRFFIILTSDHGENLIDYGMYCSHFKLFPTTTNVPLIIKMPDFPPQQSHELVQHIDLLPALCEILNMGLPPTIEGKSLLPLITQGKQVNEYVYSEHMRLLQKMVASKEWLYMFSDHQQKEWHGLKFEDRYLMMRKTKENRNVADQFPEVCKKMENIAYKTASGIPAEAEDKRTQLKDTLEALGYL